MQKNLLDENRSLQLGLIKLLACMGIVFVHSYMLHWGFFTITTEKLPAVYYVQTIFSQYIARTALPIFFAVSGYIYFAKQYQDSNWQFCRRKARGILLPYILWNSISIFYIFLAQIPELTRSCFSEHLMIASFGLERWVGAYCGWANNWFPFLYPLWFMPYLFGAFMIVHLLRKYFNNDLRLIWIAALINIICTSYTPLHSKLMLWGPFLRLIYAVSFFTMGSWLLKYRSWVDKRSTMYISGVVFAGLAAIDLAGWTSEVSWKVLSYYAGIIFLFSAVTMVNSCSGKIKNIIIFLSGFSFLIYVTHEYAMTVLVKLIYPAVPGTTGCILFMYFAIPLVLISGLILGGYCLKKLLPKVYDILFRTS